MVIRQSPKNCISTPRSRVPALSGRRYESEENKRGKESTIEQRIFFMKSIPAAENLKFLVSPPFFR
jgi:hypothetical protein